MYLKLDSNLTNQKKGYTVIELSSCSGKQDTLYLRDPADYSSEVNVMEHIGKHDKQIAQFKNPLPDSGLWVVVQESGSLNLGHQSQFMIKAYSSQEPLNDMERVKPESDTVDASFKDLEQNILNLKWKPLLNNGQPIEGVLYHIIWTTNLDANLNSACVLNEEF